MCLPESEQHKKMRIAYKEKEKKKVYSPALLIEQEYKSSIASEQK